MIKALYLFYVFKFAPAVIDQRSNFFWQRSVTLLNEQRKKTQGKFYLWKFWRIYLRDPYSIPVSVYFSSSVFHPLCFKKQ